ncbi:MAG TPA: GNAT family N-acetyltransferase [Polyangiaceae bacterium]|nr:GNAT family N-acetyltransferase [Polyangiaceae bacterium]
MTALTVEKIETFEGLLGLEREWRALESASRCGLPFLTFDWCAAWWKHLREDKLAIRDTLFVRALRSPTGELVAVAPLMVTRRPAVGPFCIRHLQFFGADPNITEVRGVLVAPDRQAEVHRLLLSHLREVSGDWDTLTLSGVPKEGQLSDVVTSAFANTEWTKETPDFVLTLAPTWEDFKGKLSRNIKESLRKCYNSLKRDGHDFKLEVTSTRGEVAAVLNRFFFLHQARAELAGTINHRNVFDAAMARRFLTDVCERFADRGTLRIFALNIGGRLAAIRVGFVLGDSLYLYYSGYDPDFAKYSVMTTAVAEAIKYAIEQQFKTVNLSTGNDVSKTRWNPAEVVFRQASIVSPSRRGELTHEVYRRARKAVSESAPLRDLAARFLARRSD